MNLSLGFPVSSELSLEAVVDRFRVAHQQPDSPIRAIHHLPAMDGTFAPVPDSVDQRLRQSLARRGIERLYSHQADAFELARPAEERGGRDAHCQRQDALL